MNIKTYISPSNAMWPSKGKYISTTEFEETPDKFNQTSIREMLKEERTPLSDTFLEVLSLPPNNIRVGLWKDLSKFKYYL